MGDWYDNLNWGQGAQGAAGGAMTGSAFGPYGAIAGGVIGGGLGLFGDSGQSGYQDQLKKLAGQYAGRQAPTVDGTTAADSAFRSDQAGLIQQLKAMAQGSGPSVAAMQMREAMDRAASAQASAAAGAGGRGVNAGAALRNAANNTAALQSAAARDTGVMRVGEQMGALGQLGGAIQGARGQDLSLNQFNAGVKNSAAQFNANAQLQQQQLNQMAQLQALQMAMGGAGAGTGSAVMAGGAQALPGILQYLSAQKGAGGGGGAALGGGGGAALGGGGGGGQSIASLFGLGGGGAGGGGGDMSAAQAWSKAFGGM